MTLVTRIKIFFNSIWNGMLGISVEILAVYIFIFAGLVVSILWWWILKGLVK
jgi:hypothetical protein